MTRPGQGYAAERLAAFHAALEKVPPGVELAKMRKTLHGEEHAELVEALDSLTGGYLVGDVGRADLEDLARELADEMVLLYGTAHVFGIDLDAAFAAVMDANMAKLPDCPNPRCDGGEVPGGAKGWMVCGDCMGSGKGRPQTRADGKVEKPAGWRAPDLAGAVR